MDLQELFYKFSQGINWNALLYFMYKIVSTAITILLYNRLDADLFCMFANLNSIVFLFVLWLDFGFQKAIPRFLPGYAKDKNNLIPFIKSIFLFRIIGLIIAIPLFFAVTIKFTQTSQLPYYQLYYLLGILLVITEGLVSLVRLLYHAYFLQKLFNSINAFILIFETLLGTATILTIQNTHFLLMSLLIWKIVGNGFLLLTSWKKASSIYQQDCKKKPHINSMHKEFFTHASIMWFNTNIKSLTERNVLMPVFSMLFGSTQANMFKVANDGALLFYRIVLKTIGTTDTALFSHVLTLQEQNETWQIAFKKLSTKIAALILPLSGIMYLIYRYSIVIKSNPFVFQLFIIIAISLLLEVLFSPYERILEVHRCYRSLACAYLPYLIMIFILCASKFMTSIGLLNSLLLIHGVRLVSAFIIVVITRVHYGLHYPVRFFLSVMTVTYGTIYAGIFSYQMLYPYIAPLCHNPNPFHILSRMSHIGTDVIHEVKKPSTPKATASETS